MTDSVDLKRALETQRVKLLRLVTGWVVMLGILSGGPLAVPLPRWVRAFFETLLIRAEYAAQDLVRVSTYLQANSGLVDPVGLPRPCSEPNEDVPSALELIQRMKALRDVLEDLPRHARRLLRVLKTDELAFDFAAPPRLALGRDRLGAIGMGWIAPRVERPPDKIASVSMVRFGTPLALRAGGGGVWSERCGEKTRLYPLTSNSPSTGSSQFHFGTAFCVA